MKIADWLATSTRTLTDQGIGTARLDCLVLLEDILEKDRALIIAHDELSLTVDQVKQLNKQVDLRSKHTPLAYIRHKTEFYKREFFINESVLEPRPESETMIDLLKDLVKTTKLTSLADIGTGSGALAITAALELPLKVLATDIDPECLTVASKNAAAHNAPITFFEGDLLTPLSNTPPVDIVLANMPYVPTSYRLNEAAMNEPSLAIFGGEDGLAIYRALFTQLMQWPTSYVFTESLPFQHSDLANIAMDAGYTLLKEDDFIQLFQKL